MNNKYPGAFISIEGTDGSGKTTLINNMMPILKEKLNGRVVFTREPGGNKISEEIRNVVLRNRDESIDPKTEALLFAASRREHVISDIVPKLATGITVISDRYVDSSLAYQGAGRKIGISKVQQINAFATDDLEPDLIVYLELDPQVGLNRINNSRPEQSNRLDKEKLSFYQNTLAGYDYLKEHKSNYFVVDANNDPVKITEIVTNKILKTIQEKENKL